MPRDYFSVDSAIRHISQRLKKIYKKHPKISVGIALDMIEAGFSKDIEGSYPIYIKKRRKALQDALERMGLYSRKDEDLKSYISERKQMRQAQIFKLLGELDNHPIYEKLYNGIESLLMYMGKDYNIACVIDPNNKDFMIKRIYMGNADEKIQKDIIRTKNRIILSENTLEIMIKRANEYIGVKK